MKKEKNTILGISIYRILGYFIIYSVLGFVMETMFALIVYGKLESRQGFLYGPVCPIYGVGAIALILALQKFKKNGYTLFFGGLLSGSIVEYVLSLLGELLLNVRWWDYSNRFLNINGRICLLYSMYWGLISIFLMKEINPRVDKFIDWIKTKVNIKVLKLTTIIIIILLIIDCILSGLVIEAFLSKTVIEKDIQVKDKIRYEKHYNTIYKDENIKNFMDNVWNEEKVIKVYPNLKLTLEDNSNIMVQDYYQEVQPYYYKFSFNINRKKLIGKFQ